jgi:hypothetical protein
MVGERGLKINHNKNTLTLALSRKRERGLSSYFFL